MRAEFWTDEILAGLPDAGRLFYIGLWMVADDEGWLRFDRARIGALLYPYRPKGRRERDIDRWTDDLVTLGRVILHDCGCAVIPTLRKHQVIGGKRSRVELDRHDREHRVRIVPEVPDSPDNRAGNGRERNGTVGNVIPRERGSFKERSGWSA